jgi:hypothetical protein
VHGPLHVRDKLRKLNRTISIAIAILESIEKRPGEHTVPLETLECRLTLGCGG